MRNLIACLQHAVETGDTVSLRETLRVSGLPAEAALAAMGFPNAAIDELRSTPFESCFAQWHADRSGPLGPGWFLWADLRSAAPRGCDVPSESSAEFRDILRTHRVRRLVASGIAGESSKLFYQTAWCTLSKGAINRALAATQFASGLRPELQAPEFPVPQEQGTKIPVRWLVDPFQGSKKPNAEAVDLAVQLGTASMATGPDGLALGQVVMTDDLVIHWRPNDDGKALGVPNAGLPIGRWADLPPEAYQALFRRANAQRDLFEIPKLDDSPDETSDDG